MSHCTKTHKKQTSGTCIEDMAQRALDLREMAFEFGDPSLIKAIDLMMYCIGKAVARERLADPVAVLAPVPRLDDESSKAAASTITRKRRRAIPTRVMTSEAA